MTRDLPIALIVLFAWLLGLSPGLAIISIAVVVLVFDAYNPAALDLDRPWSFTIGLRPPDPEGKR